MIDAREVAPGNADRDMYLDATGEPIAGASRDGALAAGIPGLPAGLAHVARHYGRLSLAESLQPAIRYAREGFVAQSGYVARLQRRAPSMNAAARTIFLPGGTLPSAGDRVVQEDLAQTLEFLARDGAAGFYAGPLAQRLVAGVKTGGGIWTLEDLAGYEVVERAPLSGTYHGVEITTAPPPSSGGVALLNMLNMLEGFDLEIFDDVRRAHVLVEVMRRAYRDRAELLGDPDFVDVPVDRLIHPYYAAGQRMTINLNGATPSDNLPGLRPFDTQGGDQTSHFSVIDRDGNAVATTQSINFSFGSGFVPAGTGVVLNNEMDDFSIKPGFPNGYGLIGGEANAIAPGKRMLSSMTPTLLESDDGLALLGTPGGSRIITMVLLAGLAWIEGADAAAMVAQPRLHHQYYPDVIGYEDDALETDAIEALQALGHSLRSVGRDYGDMHVVTWDYENGEVEAASDPRGIGEPRYAQP
jgi:gamma-glutamyltranspeptidase/glutathione hydrolase